MQSYTLRSKLEWMITRRRKATATATRGFCITRRMKALAAVGCGRSTTAAHASRSTCYCFFCAWKLVIVSILSYGTWTNGNNLLEYLSEECVWVEP